jgi:phosphatidylserine synthase 2
MKEVPLAHESAKTNGFLSDEEENDRALAQQLQVLRVRKYSDVNMYGNENISDLRKVNGEEIVVVREENENEWTNNPHTLTGGFLLMIWIIYAAFYEVDTPLTSHTNMDESEQSKDIKRGLQYASVFFLVYCMLQLPDGHFLRPHPIVWRFVTGIFILYEMLMIVLLFLKTKDARLFMRHFDSSLGIELPETSYAEDCRLYTPENPESNFINLKKTLFDRFVVMHFFGWLVGALMVRSSLICWILSILFEFYEMTFRHWLANFNECWWDHLFLDIFICNAAGIWLGMKICRMFEMKKFNWVGNVQTGKAKRAFQQFTPAYWLAYDWKIFRSANRFWRVMSMVLLLSIMMLNSFFLKSVLWVPASSYLNIVRLAIWYSAGSYAVAEYYIFSTFTIYDHTNSIRQPVKKLGPRAWLGIAVVITEICVILKHGKGMFTKPFPLPVKIAWAIVFCVVFFGSILYFWWLNNKRRWKKIKKKQQQQQQKRMTSRFRLF